MLLNFRVSNFRSINEMVELSMIPSDLKNPINVIKKTNPNATKNKDYYALTSAAIYGPNASGKSNIIRALYDFRAFIEMSTDNKPNGNIGLYDPFRLSNENLTKGSYFSIDLLIDNVLHVYSVEVSSNEILNETLMIYPKGVQVKVFERNRQKIIKGNGYEGIFETIKQRTTENQLFLGKAALENVEIAKKTYEAIILIIVFTADSFHSNKFNDIFSKIMFKDLQVWGDVLKLSKSLIQKIDTQVVDFEEIDGSIKTFHLNDINEKIEFEYIDESSGTQRVIAFSPIVLNRLRGGSILVVDEFERSLHPEIAQYILSLFNDPEVNKNGAQFIFATHDTTLLSPENNLRRDQINLVEKNSKGETELYTVSDIKGIREGNFEKWYTEGRLGAVPNIARETFRHELIEFINS
ncbi:AAA family ATPase [Flavobacterium pectinovorum]|uniref:AAA family ATPase n=1 Tax=Flavobacterium pectinovorum TaxID=29533 RepID=UPI001FADDBD4|nr:ATP-binding protein [Flavobacterium pectinovorum]MCI9843484.1 ATP-binding protein [Flavobacterium pectinovorum]